MSGIVACGFVVTVGCGGSTAASPGGGGEPRNELPGGGGHGGSSAGMQPQPDAPSPQPGTSGSSWSPGVGCAKLCVNMATFVFDSPLSWDVLVSGSIKACRNRDQACFTGTVPARGSGGNTIAFPSAQPWDGPHVWSPDEWQTIHYTWGSTNPDLLQDGDTFSLVFRSSDQERVMFEQKVKLETVVDCAGSCKSANYDLRGTTMGVGGGTRDRRRRCGRRRSRRLRRGRRSGLGWLTHRHSTSGRQSSHAPARQRRAS